MEFNVRKRIDKIELPGLVYCKDKLETNVKHNGCDQLYQLSKGYIYNQRVIIE